MMRLRTPSWRTRPAKEHQVKYVESFVSWIKGLLNRSGAAKPK